MAQIIDGENAVNVSGQGTLTANSPATTQSGMRYPFGLHYDPGMNRLYVADRDNNRISIHSVGPVPPSTSALTAVTSTAAGKIDLSWTSAGDDGVFGINWATTASNTPRLVPFGARAARPQM